MKEIMSKIYEFVLIDLAHDQNFICLIFGMQEKLNQTKVDRLKNIRL